MPLPTPILDDRSYEQLRDELVKRIGVFAPEWSDRNASDPGITLLELFAFLGENLLFRFNQIPETAYLEFLRLLDFPLRPAVAAEALVAFATELPAGAALPIGTVVAAGELGFETLTEAHAWPVSAIGVARTETALPDDPELQEYAALAIDALDLAETEEPVFYVTETVRTDAAAPDAEPVDFGRAVDGTLWLAVLAADDQPATRATAAAALAGQLLSIGFAPDEPMLRTDELTPCPGAGDGAGGPPVTWQISTGRMVQGQPDYDRVALVSDTTRGLTRRGVLALELPARPGDAGVFTPSEAVLAGTGDLPPELEDAELAARVLFWLRAFREDGGRMGRVAWVGANAAVARQARRAGPEFLGTGTGEAAQLYALVHRPVLEGSAVIEVEEPAGWRPWRAVDGFHASREDDRDFVLDHEAGTVRFGNGVQGRPPQIGERIRTTRYRYGGTAAGNVPALAIDQLAVPGVTVENPLPATGGADSEAIATALERVPGELRRRDRAVTAGDFRELALAAPGADVGRAESLPRFHPLTRITDAAGVVSVVVWPREDRRHPSAPVPGRSLVRRVCEWLDARRLVTTELYVIPPRYRPVAVAVGLQVRPGHGLEAVRRWVELVIRQYLAPLPPYGPDGGGWPLGRRVHGPELEAAALQVEGVEFLEGLRVAERATDGSWTERTVELALDEAPELVELTVVLGPPLAPGAVAGPPPPAATPVPVPTVREEC
jgi:hypothetical protein